ncbi:MAG: MgtC/SapB family protein [Candidatus Omnitrophica bacterium]|nr:MgtC/SapB family protein [Candidatus Omnitrophota bacterium]
MISDFEVVTRLFAALVLSGLVGLEREVSGRAAGFRTHILVCVGSTLIMLTSIYLFEAYRSTGAGIDPGRVAAQVVSGIGFLGAGTIIQVRDAIRGLTTAASLWVAAGIGLAVGTGFYVGAIAATAMVLIVLFLLSRLERHVVKSKRQEQELKEDV